MKRFAFAAALLTASAAGGWAACGNVAHNIVRSTECLAYTTDWAIQKQLKDVRQNALDEWLSEQPLAAASLELILKEANLRGTHALQRDLRVWPDRDMYISRGCDTLPLCSAPPRVAPMPEARKPQQADRRQTVRKRTPARRVGRNRRTGGDYCGPRDTARGYCDR
jgi:hypothetical protein